MYYATLNKIIKFFHYTELFLTMQFIIKNKFIYNLSLFTSYTVLDFSRWTWHNVFWDFFLSQGPYACVSVS